MYVRRRPARGSFWGEFTGPGVTSRLWQQAAAFADRNRQSLAFRLILPLLLCLMALGATYSLSPLRAAPTLLFFGITVLSALLGGLLSGMLATGLSLLAVDYFFFSPSFRFVPTAASDLMRAGMFLFLALVVSSVSSKRRRAELRLRQREAHFRLMLENSSDIVTILDGGGAIRYESPSVSRVLGYTVEEMLGRSAFEFVHPDDLAAVKEAFAGVLAAPGVAAPVELRFRARDGSWRVLEAVGNNLLHEAEIGGIVVHSRDITTRKLLDREHSARTAAEAAQRRFHGLVEGLEVVVWEAEPEKRKFTFISRRVEQLLGCPPQVWLDSSERWLECFAPEDRPRVAAAFASGRSADLVCRAHHASGRELWLRLVIYRRQPTEPLRGILADVTERQHAEAALRNSEKLAATGRLAATIAHEINNPLAAVTNLMYLIENQPGLDAQCREFARMATEELQRMAHITRQMLGFYRETASPALCSMPELFDSVLELYAKRIEECGARIETCYDNPPRATVFPGEIRQVFSNLLLNALDVVPAGGRIRVRIRAARRRSTAGLRISVADNGSGIPADLRERLFEPFFTTKEQKGTGLGLWVCQGIVRKHGGEIAVRSSTRPGRAGTCFSVFLPLGSGAAAESAPHRQIAAAS